MQINVTITGKDLKTQFLQSIYSEADTTIENLARIAERAIKKHINEGLKHPERSTGNLANAFYAHKDGAGWAVGDISELNSNVPYWRHVNYGSEAINANWEHWLPKGFWQNGIWVESSEGFFAKPKTPIQPMNYIEKTLLDIEIAIQQVLREGR